ncbi:MAG TPA: chorismate-binding protein, partial [Pilimelia sp.]|nr:chorismate-binding protein [Pilimelia sp.]
DPGDPADRKMAAMRGLVRDLLDRGQPMLAVCLGHQVLANLLGLRVDRRLAPYQGLQRRVDLFGTARRVGFYASFTPVSAEPVIATPYGRVELARDPVDGAVHALRGPGFAGVQFHPESVLSEDGFDVLHDLVTALVVEASPIAVVNPAQAG